MPAEKMPQSRTSMVSPSRNNEPVYRQRHCDSSVPACGLLHRRSLPFAPYCQRPADSANSRCNRGQDLPAPQSDFPPRVLFGVPNEPILSEAFRHTHFPYQEVAPRPGVCLVNSPAHVLRVSALQFLTPATQLRTVGAGPAVFLVIETV